MSNEEAIAHLVKKLEKAGLDCEDLDDLVHGAASQIGSAINNSGMDSQIEFLLEQGWTKEHILKELGLT
jgi:hypothetical protein